MQDIGIVGAASALWFSRERQSPFVLVRVPEEHVAAWNDALGVPVRRCYIDDALLEKRALETARPKLEVLGAKLPDPGSTMAGDFGEILVFIYHAAEYPNLELIGPKKWRLKQDRTKPAPYSDVVQFAVPQWPVSSSDDRLLCSEVKTKSTVGVSTPISSAIEDCEKDRTSRLTKTLLWLRDRALVEDFGSVSLAHLERFINATDHPPAQRDFRAVAVICESIEKEELDDAPDEQATDHSVVVILVPNLKQRYEEAFAAARRSVAKSDDEQ